MKRFAALAVPVLMTAAAHAQAADHSSCAPWKAKWAVTSIGPNLAAIDTLIAQIPSLCPALKAEAASTRLEAAKRIEQERATRAAAEARQQAALEAARRANDPCLQARNDWAYVQMASEATVRTYRDGLPAACGVWRNQAQEKLDGFERQRQQAEQQRLATEAQQRAAVRRTAELTTAAKATGIEGKWMFANGMRDKCSIVITFVDGILVETSPYGAKKSPIVSVSGTSVTYRVNDGRVLTVRESGGSLYWSYDPEGEHRMVHCPY